VNVKGQQALLKAALPTFNSNPEGGAFIITSSVAVRQRLTNVGIVREADREVPGRLTNRLLNGVLGNQSRTAASDEMSRQYAGAESKS